MSVTATRQQRRTEHAVGHSTCLHTVTAFLPDPLSISLALPDHFPDVNLPIRLRWPLISLQITPNAISRLWQVEHIFPSL
jgi:hypothetical protein